METVAGKKPRRRRELTPEFRPKIVEVYLASDRSSVRSPGTSIWWSRRSDAGWTRRKSTPAGSKG